MLATQVSDYAEELYQHRFQHVRKSHPEVDPGALADAFIAGAGAFAEVNRDVLPTRDELLNAPLE